MADLRACFKVLDVDESGTLSTEELARILVRSEPSFLSMDDVSSLIADFDMDGDGELNVDEFLAALERDAGARTQVINAHSFERREFKVAKRAASLELLQGHPVDDLEDLIARAERLGLTADATGLRNLAAKSAANYKAAQTSDSLRNDKGELPGRPATTFIKVAMMTGMTLRVPVDPVVDTVRDVCDAVGAMTGGISADRVRLIWCGFQICDFPRFDGALEDIRGFGIDSRSRIVGDRFTKTDLRMQFGEDGSTLHCVLRLRG